MLFAKSIVQPTLTDVARAVLDEHQVDEPLLEAMSAVVASRLRRRGLWRAPPSFLGYDDLVAWSEPSSLRLLAFEAAHACVKGRERSLRARLKTWDSIDGLMLKNIDWFLAEKQRKADPVGAAIFSNVKAAILLGVEAGLLVHEQPVGQSQIAAYAVAPADPLTTEYVTLEALACLLEVHEGWLALCRDVVRSGGLVQQKLHQHLESTLPAGTRFKLYDLVAAIAPSARAAWTQVYDPDPDTLATEGNGEQERMVIKVAEPQHLAENPSDWLRLAAVIVVEAERTGRWRVPVVLQEWVAALQVGDDVPSTAEVARRLAWTKGTAQNAVRDLRQLAESTLPPAYGLLASADATSQNSPVGDLT